jgi:hypothetical protein
MLALCALALLPACATQTPVAATPSPNPSPTDASPPAATPRPSPIVTLPDGASVFVVVMENRTSADSLAQPYTAGLAGRYALAADYHAVSHPSLPNYLALTSGSTYGIADDSYHQLPAGGLGAQLSQRRISWRAYMEGMGANCLSNQGRYALKHDPFPFYGGACPSNVVPFDSLNGALAGGTPRFVWITPDLCNDGHDCGSQVADSFLRGLVPRILASPAWTSGGVLFLTWDEDDGSSTNQVATIVASPNQGAHRSARAYTHYSLLATVEDLLGVPRLGQAAQAQPMDDLLQP